MSVLERSRGPWVPWLLRSLGATVGTFVLLVEADKAGYSKIIFSRAASGDNFPVFTGTKCPSKVQSQIRGLYFWGCETSYWDSQPHRGRCRSAVRPTRARLLLPGTIRWMVPGIGPSGGPTLSAVVTETAESHLAVAHAAAGLAGKPGGFPPTERPT